jgi:hypothetical protein
MCRRLLLKFPIDRYAALAKTKKCGQPDMERSHLVGAVRRPHFDLHIPCFVVLIKELGGRLANYTFVTMALPPRLVAANFADTGWRFAKSA